MEEILSALNEIMDSISMLDAKVEEVKNELSSISEEVGSLSRTLEDTKECNENSLSDVTCKLDELVDTIDSLRGVGPDDTITDLCNKVNVIIRGAGYTDDTLGIGSKLVDGQGRTLVVTKYDADGIEVEYAE